MKDTRVAIPASVRRCLRQEAAFGCCKCGHPFVQYHHIVPWAEDQHFRPEDMMAACAQCHYLFTTGAIDAQEQRKIKANPFNIASRQMRGMLYVNSKDLCVELAGGVAINTPALLMVRSETVLGAKIDSENGRVLISAILHGSDGATIGCLYDNEWNTRVDELWDMEIAPCRATLRHGPRQISFGVDTRNDTLKLRGQWKYDNRDITFDDKVCRFGDMMIAGMKTTNCGVFINLN